MTTADMLRAEGAAAVLVRLLTRRFGPLPGDVRIRIEAASREQLDLWTDRLLDAEALDEVFP